MEKVQIITILIFLIAQTTVYGFPIGKSAEEMSGNFEGDMELEAGQLRNVMMKVGLTSDHYRWLRNRHGTVVVPYTIRDGSPYTSGNLQQIQVAMSEIENKTCIKFTRRQNETDYVEIFSGNGCFSSVGRLRGRQNLSLMQFGCLRHGIIVHELLHALGFFHMQSSYDRDNYVRINFENIESGRENNFQMYPNSIVSHFQTSYDLDSLMHYTRTAFSRNGQATIETRDPKDSYRIGQRSQMSLGDVDRVKNMYCN